MFSCIICLDTLKAPVALPCGHVFCYGCVERIVTTIKPFTSQHCCPSCRRPYTISTIDPSMVPDHLQPYIFAPIRRLYLDLSPSPPPASQSSHPRPQIPQVPPTEVDAVKAENLALRAHVEMWKRRAEVHSAANLGLVNLSRMARDYAVNVKREKDAMEMEVRALKRKLGETVADGASHTIEVSASSSTSASTSSPLLAGSKPCVKHEQLDIPSIPSRSPVPIHHLSLPEHVPEHLPEQISEHIPAECDDAEGPARKRKRVNTPPAKPVRRSTRHQRCSRLSTPQVCN